MPRVAPALFFPLLAPLPMSFFSLLGAVEIGLIFSLVALGVFISFRLLRFPDLTVDGSFPLGGAVCAILISTGTNAWVATLAATAAGAVAGLITGWLNVKLKIMDLLASILMMIALYSINLRIMGGPNVPLINDPTLFVLLQPEGMQDYIARPLILAVIVVAAKLLLDWFFATERGLAIRATGSNARMARAQGVNTGAIGADDGDELPGRNVQRHAAQGAGFDRRAGVEGDFEVLGAQHGALSVRGFRTACAWRTCA